MDTSHNERNRAQTERMKALDARLSDQDLQRPMGDGGWTVAVAMAHVGYWDGRMLAALEAAARHGVVPAWWDTGEADAVNAARLPTWKATPPRDALREAIRNAEALDRFLEGLSPDMVERLRSDRPTALDRARHRGSHLDDVEAALGAA